MGTRAASECFHSILEFSQTFYNSIENTEEMFSISFGDLCAEKKGKSLSYLHYQVVNSPCSAARVSFPVCVSIEYGVQHVLF